MTDRGTTYKWTCIVCRRTIPRKLSKCIDQPVERRKRAFFPYYIRVYADSIFDETISVSFRESFPFLLLFS